MTSRFCFALTAVILATTVGASAQGLSAGTRSDPPVRA